VLSTTILRVIIRKDTTPIKEKKVNVIIPISPHFAEKIFEGSKKFEFRKILFNVEKVHKVLLYASSPVQRVVGEFTVGDVLSYPLPILWDKTKAFSGVSEDFFLAYFDNRTIGHALLIKSPIKYENPLSLKEDFGKCAPQLFTYVESKGDPYVR
jgi:predicted transcriptional regulator